MSLGIRDSRRTQRKRTLLTAVKLAVALAGVAILAVYAYQSGATFGTTSLAEAEAEVARLKGEALALRDERAVLIKQLEDAKAQLERPRDLLAGAASAGDATLGEEERLRLENERLGREIGELASALRLEMNRHEMESVEGVEAAADPVREQLVAVLQGKLAAGVPADALHAAIGALEPSANPPASTSRERICDRELATRRFIVRTEIYAGANDSVTFENNALTITATGPSVIAANGSPESWFDPTKPITVSFAHTDGYRSDVVGVLPFSHSVTIGGLAERYDMEAGNRGFVRISGGRCRYQ